MLRVLLRTHKLVVLSVMLFSATICFSRNITPVKNAGRYLSVTAPADITVNVDEFSNVATGVNLGSPVISDDAVSINNNAPTAFPIGKTYVIWSVNDGYGNTATATQTVTVIDNQKPYISRLGNISVPNAAGACNAVVTLRIPFAYDNSGQVTVTHDGPSVFPVGTTMLTWTATDASGNFDTIMQKVTVIDNELPKISVVQSTIEAGVNNGQCGATLVLALPTVSDNCGIAGISNNAPAVFPVGTTTVKWTVTDLTGYKATATQTVIVTDDKAPVIIAPPNIVTNAATVAIGNPVVSDNCGISSVVNNAPSLFPVGTTQVIWSVTDIHGNVSTATQLITFNDTEAPVLSGVPGNSTVSCENVPAPASVTATDNSGVEQVVSMVQTSTQGSNSNSSSFYNYKITRTWTCTDNSGNSITAKQVITVQDKTAPVIIAPSISTSNDVNKCSAVVSYNVSVSDNSGGPVSLTYSKPAGSVFSSGSTSVLVTARDASGNSRSSIFVVTVTDTQKPTITAPANVSVSTSSSSGTSNVKLGTASASDNCGVQSISNNAPSKYPVGTTLVTWTAKDKAGNTSTAVQAVIVSYNKRRNNSSTDNSQSITTEDGEDNGLSVKLGSNPSISYFTLYLQSPVSTPVAIRVSDALGRVVDARSGITANGSVQIGHNYGKGTYIAEIVQGRTRKTVQLIKIQ